MPQYTDAILITLFIVILILIVALIISLLAPTDTSKPDTVPSRRPRGFFSTQLGLIILLVLAALLLSRISAIPATQRPLSEPFSLLNLLKPLPWPEIILSALVLVALFGIYPLSYLAYKLVVSKSQQKRLQDDLILLGYPEAAVQNAKDLFNITYSTKQYNGYILLILLIMFLHLPSGQ